MATATLDVPEQNPDLVLDQSADDYWNHYQLTFALYSVSDRAIPSAFDGLKPGQRRLLYQMHDSRLLPGNKPQKSSKVCSAVTGNLHPHGGASMYGAAALMAAEFQRVKVIDGQGAFPRIQGDIPAADRYTEMRLSAPGAALTSELNDHAVPMVSTFDGEWIEPTVLPAQWPVLLCNGAVGIAEGWATKVPAHNPREVMAACRALLKTPNMTDDRLVKLIPGPDWGCGATVVGITELPPGVASSTVQDRIRALVESGELSGVADMSDLTDRRNGLRIVVTAKRGHSAETIREQLLALTPLESTFAASLVALDEDRVPRWWSVRELIAAFLHLRDSVVPQRVSTGKGHRAASSGGRFDDHPPRHRRRGGGDPRIRHRRRGPPGTAGAVRNRYRTSRLRSGAAAAAVDQARCHRAAGRSGEAGCRVSRAHRIGVES